MAQGMDVTATAKPELYCSAVLFECTAFFRRWATHHSSTHHVCVSSTSTLLVHFSAAKR